MQKKVFLSWYDIYHILLYVCHQLCYLSANFKIERYFPPTSEVRFINEVQSDMIYIGKLKVVPSDYSFSFDREKALKAIIKDAKKCGARNLYVKGLNVTSSYYTVIPWDWTLGDGVTVEAELYY